MKIIKENNISAVEAMSFEDSTYPKENAISKQPVQVTKSTNSLSEIILSCGNFNSIAFFRLDAVSGGLEVVDHNAATAKVLTGSDIFISDDETIESTSTDLSGLDADDEIVMYGWEEDSNNGSFTVSIASTANSIIVKNNPLTVSIAGRDITVVRFNDSDKVIDEDLSFVYCPTWTDWFGGNARLNDSYSYESDDIYTESTIRVSIYGTLPEVGLIFAGMGRNIGVAQYGTSIDPKDNSIYRKSANGALNQVQRAINIDSTVQVSCSRAEAAALENLFKYDNDKYMVFLLKTVDTATGLQSQLLYYGKIERKPRLTWNMPDRMGYTLEITSIGGYE